MIDSKPRFADRYVSEKRVIALPINRSNCRWLGPADDVIIFPADATGRQAVAQGQVEVLDMTRERYEGWMQHLAEEQGETFDPSTIGEGPYRLVQIRGTGAEIGG